MSHQVEVKRRLLPASDPPLPSSAVPSRPRDNLRLGSQAPALMKLGVKETVAGQPVVPAAAATAAAARAIPASVSLGAKAELGKLLLNEGGNKRMGGGGRSTRAAPAGTRAVKGTSSVAGSAPKKAASYQTAPPPFFSLPGFHPSGAAGIEAASYPAVFSEQILPYGEALPPGAKAPLMAALSAEGDLISSSPPQEMSAKARAGDDVLSQALALLGEGGIDDEE